MSLFVRYINAIASRYIYPMFRQSGNRFADHKLPELVTTGNPTDICLAVIITHKEDATDATANQAGKRPEHLNPEAPDTLLQ
jgi:hypothetical protein